MTKSFRDIMAQKGVSRTNSTLDKPSRCPNRRSAIRKDVPRSPVGTEAWQKQSTEGSLEISRKKAASTALKVLQLTS